MRAGQPAAGRPHLAGTEASGLFEARLGAEEMPGKEVHVFCAAYRADEFAELLQYADHIVLNSPGQLAQFGPAAKAAGKSEDVVVLAYDEARIEPWWQSRKGDMSKIDKLSVRWIADTDLEKLADMAGRNMKFAATVQDGVVWLADDSHNIEIEVKTLMRRGEPVF